MGELVSIKKGRKQKFKVEEFLQSNPEMKQKLNDLSMEYIEKVHEFMSKNTDVQAIVKVSFEFFKE